MDHHSRRGKISSEGKRPSLGVQAGTALEVLTREGGSRYAEVRQPPQAGECVYTISKA